MYTNRRTIELLKQPKNIKDLLHRAIHIFQGDIFFEKTYPDAAEQAEFGAPSVQIYLSCVDYIVTLYRLRRPSGRPPDYTTYTRHKGRRTNI